MSETVYQQGLDLDALAPGSISRVLITLVHDQLGGPVRVPLLVARGARPGPVIGLTAALHGNELNGIPVIHRLFGGLDPERLRGDLVAVLVSNVPGFQRRQRGFMDGQDLNHLMPGKPRGDGGQVYAWRLVDRVVQQFDMLIDLHTASVGRVNCLYIRADLTDPRTARMAYLLHPQLVLHNPANDRTLRGTAMGRGIPAITVEIGNPQRFHPEYVQTTVAGIRRILSSEGMLPRRKPAENEHPVICRRSRWMYTQQGGLLEVLPGVTETVAKGEIVARVRDIWGDLVEEYEAPFDGVVIGRSVDPVAETGARILHLGEPADPDDPRFLRRDEEGAFPPPLWSSP